MGLFSKEPAEKKAYDKALVAMLSKPNEKNLCGDGSGFDELALRLARVSVHGTLL